MRTKTCIETLHSFYLRENVNNSQGECFYLRLLLYHVRGPQSFSHLKTVEGDLCSSFCKACFRLGLPEDDNQYHLAMQEASVTRGIGIGPVGPATAKFLNPQLKILYLYL